MLKSYITIAWRSLLKNRQFTFLNLVGLSTGLACALLIFLWVNDELQVDKFLEKDDRLFQVMVNHREGDVINTIVETPLPLAAALATEMPEVEHAVCTYPTIFRGTTTLSHKNKNIAANGLYAGKDYFHVFSYQLIRGDRDRVLADKHSIVLSKGLALKLFNTTDNIVGETVAMQKEEQYVVSGVFQDPPSNSTQQFDYLVSTDVLLDFSPYLKEWSNSDPRTYVVLKAGANKQQFARKVENFLKTKSEKSNAKLLIRPYSDGYLYSKYENGVQAGGRITYVKMFFIIAVFILIIACVNFMNLCTAKASGRMKEVGVRKVIGAKRGDLIARYMGESFLMAFFSMLLAIQLVYFLIPSFNHITGKQLTLFTSWTPFIYLLTITVFTGFVAGSYPALYLSGFNPGTVLKGMLKTSPGELLIRKGLVIFQFTLSVIFIVAVLVVYKQITFIQTKNMGYNRDNVVNIEMTGSTIEDIIKNTQTYQEEAKHIPGVINASSMDHASLVGDFGSTSDLQWEGKAPGEAIGFGNIGINYDLIETMGIQIAEGRSFSRTLSSDSSEIILNETAVKKMGIKNPVGKIVKMWGVDRKVAGIAKDFHFQSVHETVKPFALRLEPAFTNNVVVKIRTGKEKETMDQLQRLYAKVSPGFTFNYKFLDQAYQAQYVSEMRVAALSKYFAGLTILISCLGLFGLAAFTAQRRQKEIGIRKIMGATVGHMALLLSKDFLQLILIAILIAFPLAWWAMQQWLKGFAYSIDIGIGTFVAAGIVTILITLLTISFQAIKAAIMNPVQSLKVD